MGVLVLVVVLFLLYARIFGFDPGANRAGLWLSGEVVNEKVTDWTFAKDIPIGETAIQTHQRFFPLLPHSIRTGRSHDNGRLYYGALYPGAVGFGEGRYWNRNVAADSRVRIKLRDKLYDVKFVPVTDPAERDANLKKWGRSIWAPGMYMYLWRVEPRD
jgi:hypothetical protein